MENTYATLMKSRIDIMLQELEDELLDYIIHSAEVEIRERALKREGG